MGLYMYVYIKCMYVYRCEKCLQNMFLCGYPWVSKDKLFSHCMLSYRTVSHILQSKHWKLINKTYLESTREEHVFVGEGNL